MVKHDTRQRSQQDDGGRFAVEVEEFGRSIHNIKAFLCPQNFCFGGMMKLNHLSLDPFVHSSMPNVSGAYLYITLDRNTFGTNVLLEKAMCRMQDPGLYIKGQGHNHRSKVKKWDKLLCPDYNFVFHE